MSALLYALAHAALFVWGLPAAFHPSLRAAPLEARAAAALAYGAVALTIEATILSIVGIPWTVATLSIPLLAFSIGLSVRWARRPAPRDPAPRASRAVRAAAAAIGAFAGVHLLSSLAATRATSTDFVLFWGVKGARFAAARGIDSEVLRYFFSFHMVPDYPPLVPVLSSWGTLVAGELPWSFAPVVTALWVAAAIPLLLHFLRRRMSPDAAVGVATFWAVVFAISIVRTSSGGNAEGPLLFFETAALAALLAERPEEPARSRFFPALALSGAALTKVEGLVAVLLMLGGVALRDRLERRPRPIRRLLPLAAAPLAGVGVWFAFQAVRGLAVGYRTHGELLDFHFRYAGSILREAFRSLDAGTAGISWIVPLVLLVASAREWRSDLVLPLGFAAGLLLFFVFDYLHDPSDPTIRIGWTLPRISQPALSAVILAAGIASAVRGKAAPGGRRTDPGRTGAQRPRPGTAGSLEPREEGTTAS